MESCLNPSHAYQAAVSSVRFEHPSIAELSTFVSQTIEDGSIKSLSAGPWRCLHFSCHSVSFEGEGHVFRRYMVHYALLCL